MSYLFNEANPLGGTGGQFSGKNKGVLVTNTGASNYVDLYTYNQAGRTAATRVGLLSNQTLLIPVRIWGISCGSGVTASVIS
jgi:hypothetical protein